MERDGEKGRVRVREKQERKRGRERGEGGRVCVRERTYLLPCVFV